MKERNTSNWDTMDFQDWVVRNIHLILSGKQLELFMKNNFGYDDLKFFGKIKRFRRFSKILETFRTSRKKLKMLENSRFFLFLGNRSKF